MTDDDDTLVELVDAARSVVAWERHDGLCWYRDSVRGHRIGSNRECPLCRLSAATAPYEVEA